MRVVWMPQAVSDLETVRQFIERDSTLYARLVVERLFNAAGQLNTYPESGRVVPELNRPTVRELIRGSYRIVYRLEPDAVRILTIVHASRLLPVDVDRGAR